MASTLDSYGKNLTITTERNGSELSFRPKVYDFRNFTITEQSNQNKITIQVDTDALAALTSYTGSINGKTYYVNPVPRFAEADFISSGSEVTLSCSLKEDSFSLWQCEAHVYDVDSSATKFIISEGVRIEFFSGSAPNILKTIENVADNYNNSLGSLSASLDITTNHLVWHLTSNTGSNYTYSISATSEEKSI